MSQELFNAQQFRIFRQHLERLFTGFHGVYQGVVPTILKQGSNQAIRFFVIETLKHWYRGEDHNKSVPIPVVGAFGAFAGACSVYGNTPIDVVKTRLQVKYTFLT